MKTNVCIVGLGLIGGSLAKALSRFTDIRVEGYDRDTAIVKKAVSVGAISQRCTNFSNCDYIFVALYPRDSIRFVKDNISEFSKTAVLVDFCGVKKTLCETLQPLCEQNGICYVPCHPMAGKESSGFEAAASDLFHGASLIMTPASSVPNEQIENLSKIMRLVGVSKIIKTTPENHDRMIAFTSQLPHVISNAYVKSPEAAEFQGFTAGSFRDFTRVAHVNESMWAELFLDNAQNLSAQISLLIDHLQEVKFALDTNNRAVLCDALTAGNAQCEKIRL